MSSFVLKGDIAFNETREKIHTIEDGFLVCEDGICKGAFEVLPEEYQNLPVKDFTGKLIVPGMTDLHVHAPQYTFRGIGMDLELLDWLNQHTFPEEAHYKDLEYAKKAYSYFTYDLKRSFSTRAVIFATMHTDATVELMDQLEETGVISYVGRVNMDRNGGVDLQEASAEVSLQETREWLARVNGRYARTFPILTPRFIPSCSDELMKGLGALSEEMDLRIQSHLSENPSEVAWVKELVPESTCYANAYEIFDTMGNETRPTIMAHCVYSDEKEMEILKKHGAYIAHCSDSNMNLTSGIAPIRKFMDAGIRIGIGTDVAAGSSMNMLKAILNAIQASKMYYRLVDQSVKPLTFEETFYLATEGGGSYFGKVGSFKDGYEFDALVLDDSKMYSMRNLSVRERLERTCYNDADVIISHKFVKGENTFHR